MAFEFNLGKVKESLVNAGKEVESMAKDASAVAKLKIDIHNKETFLEKQYALLGKAFYEAHKEEEEPEQNTYFPSIKEAEAELTRLQEELLSAQGAVVCPSCGVKQTEKHDFCSSCGTALKTEEAAPEVVADVEIVEEADSVESDSVDADNVDNVDTEETTAEDVVTECAEDTASEEAVEA